MLHPIGSQSAVSVPPSWLLASSAETRALLRRHVPSEPSVPSRSASRRIVEIQEDDPMNERQHRRAVRPGHAVWWHAWTRNDIPAEDSAGNPTRDGADDRARPHPAIAAHGVVEPVQPEPCARPKPAAAPTTVQATLFAKEVFLVGAGYPLSDLLRVVCETHRWMGSMRRTARPMREVESRKRGFASRLWRRHGFQCPEPCVQNHPRGTFVRNLPCGTATGQTPVTSAREPSSHPRRTSHVRRLK